MDKKKEFDLVSLVNVQELSIEVRQFKDIHNEICYHAQKSAENFCYFLKSLQKMKNGKFYESVGFKNFEAYCEDELGIKRRQAYNYLEIAEKLPEDFVKSNADLGVTKLQLLTTLDENERTELLKNIDVKNSRVDKVRDAVAEERAKREQAEKRLKAIESVNKDLEKENEKLNDAYSDIALLNKSLEKELEKAKKEPTIVYQDNIQTMNDLSEMTQKAKDLEESEKKKTERIEELEKELNSLKSKKTNIKDEKTLKLERKIQELKLSLETAKSSKTTISSDSIVAFKVRFDLWQKNGADLLSSLNSVDEDKREKCKLAVVTVLNKLLGDLK